ncbi:MAG: peroxiredoxin family protein [Armatimonadota bacterium]
MSSSPGAILRRFGRLVRIGARAELRNPGLRLLAAVGAVAAGIYSWNHAGLAATTAVVLAEWLGRAFGVAACLWFAYAAIRDYNERTGAALRSKPVDGAFWVMVNWATGAVVWIVLLALPFLISAVVQLPWSGLSGVIAHAIAFLHAAVILAFVSALSYGLSRLWRSPLGGILTLFGWFCAIAGLDFIPAYLQPDYAQNLGLFAAAAAFMLAVTGLLVERFRRGELRRPLVPVIVAAALLGLTAAGAAQAYRVAPRVEDRPNTIWDPIAVQHIQEGEVTPGFWLPDGKGGIVRTASHAGKILVIYLFAASDPDAARTLPVLEALQAKFGERGVQPIGICFSPDQGDGWTLARTSGYSFPIGWDPTTLTTTSPPQAAVAEAYDTELLPKLVITDRRRRARSIGNSSSYSLTELEKIIEDRLAAEPE